MRKTDVEIKLRWMIRRDVEAVAEIEQALFNEPWTAARFSSYLSDRKSVGIIAEVDGEIIGYAVYTHRNGVINLDNLGVVTHWQREGVATAILCKIKSMCGTRNGIIDSVSEDNLPMQLFLKSQGFTACVDADDPAYYLFGWEPSQCQ